MIYLDNAATTMRKPQTVIDAVTQAMCSLGNAGRGATSGALDAARTIHGCRAKLARLLGCPRADHVCFTPNSTAALNTAINGVVRPGDHVVTTVLEHNSVLRPLNRLATEQGVTVEHAGCDASGALDYDELERLVTPGTRAVVVTHASNVTGNAVDVSRVAAIAHAAGALVIVDASQSAGTAKIDMDAMGLDVVCFTGHKGLMGPQGTGGLAVAEGIDVAPWAMGGTGVVFAIFFLACMNVCIGLISCCSRYFCETYVVEGGAGASEEAMRRPFAILALVFAAFSCVLSNVGLDVILMFSVPMLNALYPVAIVLVLMGLMHGFCDAHPQVWVWVGGVVAVQSVITSVRDAFFAGAWLPFDALPLADIGAAWAPVAVVAFVIGLVHSQFVAHSRS